MVKWCVCTQPFFGQDSSCQTTTDMLTLSLSSLLGRDQLLSPNINERELRDGAIHRPFRGNAQRQPAERAVFFHRAVVCARMHGLVCLGVEMLSAYDGNTFPHTHLSLNLNIFE